MANSIAKGITITFRGDTTEFDKGVSKINGELKSLKDETKLLNRELKLDPNNFDKLSQKLTVLQHQEDLIKEKIEAYKQALSTMDKDSAEFEKTTKEVRNLQIELGYLEKNIKQMGGNQLSLALNVLGTSLENAGKKVSDLGNKFKGLSTVATGILAGFGKLSYDTVKYADDINTLSKQTGLSTDTLQTFGQVADLIDVDLNSLAKTSQYLTKNLDNKTALETYKKLGVAVKDNNGNYRDTESILFDTIKALQGVEDETERSILANDVFGKSYTNLGAILNDSSVDLEEVSQLVKENGKVLSKDQLNALNKVNDNIDKLKMKFKGLGTSLVADFQEPLSKLIEKVVELANKVVEFVEGLSTEQKERILTIITIVAGIAPVLTIVGGVITKVGSAIKVVSTILTTVIPIIQTLFTTLMANPIGLVVAGIVALIAVIVVVVKNFDAIKEKVSEVWEKFKQTEFVQKLIEYFETFKEILDKVVESIKNVFEWIGNTIGKVGDFLSSGISKVAGWFGGGFNSGGFSSGGFSSGGVTLNANFNITNGNNIDRSTVLQWADAMTERINENLGVQV